MDRPQRSGSALGRAIALASLTLGILSRAGPASADPKLQAVGGTSVGYSDNIQSVPDKPVPGVPPKAAGAFVLVSPGVVLASASPRVIHRLSYLFSYDVYFQQDDASTASNQLEYRGFFDLSPRVNLLAGAAAMQTNQYNTFMLAPPGAGAVNATPSGSGNFLSATADELLSIDLGPDLRGREGLGVAEDTPLFGSVAPRTFVGNGRLGLDRAFRSDAVGVEARAEYSIIDGSFAFDGQPQGQQQQLVATSVALWRRDWTRELSSRLEAGALWVQRVNTGHHFWEPAGTAALAYTTDYGDAEIAYDHTVTTNLMLGQTFLVDEVRLRGSVPLTKKREVTLSASAGYQLGQVLDDNLTLAARVDAILADVGPAWQVSDLLLLGIRYQYIGQISDAKVPPLPLTYVRNTVMVGATFRFPSEREMPRAYRAPRRVDGSDEVREGIQPAQQSVPRGPGGGGT